MKDRAIKERKDVVTSDLPLCQTENKEHLPKN